MKDHYWQNWVKHGDLSIDRQRAMSWTQRPKWVFAADIETFRECGGRLWVIANIDVPAVT